MSSGWGSFHHMKEKTIPKTLFFRYNRNSIHERRRAMITKATLRDYLGDRTLYASMARIAIPISLQSLITVGINLMDTIMLSGMGDAQLSAGRLQAFHRLTAGGGQGRGQGFRRREQAGAFRGRTRPGGGGIGQEESVQGQNVVSLFAQA